LHSDRPGKTLWKKLRERNSQGNTMEKTAGKDQPEKNGQKKLTRKLQLGKNGPKNTLKTGIQGMIFSQICVRPVYKFFGIIK